MSHDRVAAVDHAGVVTALVEHAQVAAQHAGEVHVAVHGTLVGADHDELLLIKADLGVLLQQALEHLIGGHCIVEAEQRHSVLNAGIVGIKGDDVAHAHGLQLLQGHSAVQTLANHAAMLTAAVQAGHDNGHTVCLTGHCLDQALEVGKVVIRGEVVLITEQVVGNAVIARIDNDKDIVAAHRLPDQALCVTALEAGALAGDDKAILLHACGLCPFHQMLVDQLGQLLCTGAGQQTQVCHAGFLEKCHRIDLVGHTYNSFNVPVVLTMKSDAESAYLFLFYHKKQISTHLISVLEPFSAACTAVVQKHVGDCEFHTKNLPFTFLFPFPLPAARWFLRTNPPIFHVQVGLF